MHSSPILALAAGLATAQAVSTGFNYGNTFTDGSYKQTSDYESEFQAAKALPGTNGEFTSARIYTMIQGGTTDSPSAAIEAAMNTGTTLLLGMWASEDQSAFQNEINALTAAIQQYGESFTKLVVGLSVGSEDLYRESPTGIENGSNPGQSPSVLVSYIKQARAAIANTGLSSVPVGHVDTWTAWVNSSNFEVTDNCDWLGVDSYPYFETTVANAISDGNATFWDSYDQTVSASQGKPVWVTETGWPVSGSTSGQAIPSVQNAETYWQEVACTLLPSYNTWWYTLQDADPTTPNPSFGILGSNLDSAPLYNLTCSPQSTTTSSTRKTPGGTGILPPSNGTVSSGISTATSASMGYGSTASASGSMTASAAGTTATAKSTNAAPKTGAAAGAAILAIFGLVAAL